MSPTIPNGEAIPALTEQNEDPRLPRTEETREQTARAPLQYVEPTLFPDPVPQDGFVFRWVCETVGGVTHQSNISKRAQEGWQHVDASEQPGVCEQIGMQKKDPRSKFRGSIRYLGMVLCKKPVELDLARKRHFAKLANQQMDVVDNQNVAQTLAHNHGAFRNAEKQAQVVYTKTPDA